MLFLTTYAIGVSQTIKIYYDVDVEKGAYIYSDSDNTQDVYKRQHLLCI